MQKPLKPCSSPMCPELIRDERYCNEHKKVYNDKKRNRNEWQRLYSTARWKRLRERLLRENSWCDECMKEDRLEPATVADHIEDHKGNERLFYDYNNLQALCKRHHDRKTAYSTFHNR